MSQPSYASLTRETREPLKALAHSRRLQQAARLVKLQPHWRVFDYGCGDGAFFENLSEHVEKNQLFGFDPWLLDQMIFVGASTYDNVNNAGEALKGTIDIIYCMEVCEHLSDRAIDDVFRNMKMLGKQDALFVFGVPIETGLASVAKNIYRIYNKNRQGANWNNLLRAMTSQQVERSWDNDWCGSHLGFDHKIFERKLLASGFTVKKKHCLPLKFFGPIANNEIYYICEGEK